MPLSFKEHTYDRRQWFMSHFYIEEMVYGDIGVNPNTGKHAITPHFKQLNASYPSALENTLKKVKTEWDYIVYPHPTDFEQLYNRLYFKIGNVIKGIGALAVYDIALNIGINLYPKVLPEKYVYVHFNCVRKAAKDLLNIQRLKGDKIETGKFAQNLPHLTAMDVEDALCVYHKIIEQKKTTFSHKDLAKMPPDSPVRQDNPPEYCKHCPCYRNNQCCRIGKNIQSQIKS